MKKYESVVMLKPDLNKSKLSETILSLESKIKEFAEITNKEEIGLRTLAYEVRKCKEAYYLVYQFEVKENINSNVIAEIEKYYRITDEIIKYMTLKCEE